MEKWFCIWDDLANPKIGLNLTQTRCSTRTLPAMLNDPTITTVYKVIGGLSASDFGLDFVAGFKFCALNQLLSVDIVKKERMKMVLPI